MRRPLAPLADVYRRLPEGVRYSLRPLNALDEIGTHLPPRGRLAAQRFVGGVRSLAAAVRGRNRLVRLSGVSAVDGGPFHALVDLGREGEAFWGGLLFAGRPTRTVVGETRSPLGMLHAGADRLDADIVLLHHHRFARRAAERAGFITVPSWVETAIDTRGALEDVLARSRFRRTLKSDLKRIQREGLVARIGAREDVATFLHDMYQPFARARWGASYVSLPESWMRQAPRFCEVLWIERRGERIGAALLEPRGAVLRDVAMAAHDPEDPHGVRAAGYFFAIRHAIDRGYHTLAVGGCRPVLSDGVLRTKLKWGAHLLAVLQWDYLALALPRGSQALRGLLAAHPLVAEAGGGLFAVVDPAATELPDVPGLAGAIVPRPGGWATRARPVGGVRVAPAT
jgi:hypothetical protein